MTKLNNFKKIFEQLAKSSSGIGGFLLERMWLTVVFVALVFLIYSALIYYQYVIAPPQPKNLLVARDFSVKTALFEQTSAALKKRAETLKDTGSIQYLDPFR